MSTNPVRAFRERFGLSQPALGELLGVTSRTISTWENEREPRLVVMLALAELGRMLPYPQTAAGASSATDSVSTCQTAAAS